MLHRYILSYRDPRTKKRVQKFFARQKDAQAEQAKVLADIRQGLYIDQREAPTVEEAFDHWLNDRRGHIKPQTASAYEHHRPYVVGPLLLGKDGRRLTLGERAVYGRTKKVPEGCYLREMFGKTKVTDLTTAEIRIWHKLIADNVSSYTANRSRQHLKTLLDIMAEDYNIRPPVMPRRKGRGKPKEKKAILLPDQVRKLLEQAENDLDYGIYYAFPFLTGVRPSEQLGLLWEDVDIQKRTIRICRMQEKNGAITDITKTAAGTRTIPMSALLQRMLTDWRERCPRREGQPHRVFPNIGFRRFKNEPRNGGGYCLLYTNFCRRVWHRALKRAGLPRVTPHSARHCFISTLQAQGVEVGLVAQMAGHASVTVTLSHYTQAVRGGEEAVEALARAFQMPEANIIAAGSTS